MLERKVTLSQVLTVLRDGIIFEHAHQNIRGHWKCTLSRVVAGDDLKVACALEQSATGELVVVITVIS